MKLFALISILFLSACGFSPVYGDRTVQSDLAEIVVSNIPNRSGQIVRNHLIDTLYRNGAPINAQYELIIAPIIETEVEIGIDQDDEASRAQLRLRTLMQIRDVSNNTIILTRSVRATTGYNILDGQFTTFVTKADARNNALRVLSDNIITQLELHFRR